MSSQNQPETQLETQQKVSPQVFIPRVKALDLPLLPYGPRLLIEPQRPKTHTEGGLELPQDSRRKIPLGRIIACGLSPNARVKDEAFRGFQIGQEVLYQSFAGVPYPLPGFDHLLLVEVEHVLAVGPRPDEDLHPRSLAPSEPK